MTADTVSDRGAPAFQSSNEAHRADDARLPAFVLLVDDAQPALVPERGDQLGEGLVGDAAAQLAVQRIDGGLTQRIAVDIVDGLPQRRRVEHQSLDALRVALQALVGAKTRPGGPTELPPDLPLLAGRCAPRPWPPGCDGSRDAAAPACRAGTPPPAGSRTGSGSRFGGRGRSRPASRTPARCAGRRALRPDGPALHRGPSRNGPPAAGPRSASEVPDLPRWRSARI